MGSIDVSRTTSRVVMVEPVRFHTNEETLPDNLFMAEHGAVSKEEIEERALGEFRQCVTLLRDHGVNVTVFTPHAECESPDVVFCPHWFTTHLQLGGMFVLYSLRSPKRRTERSPQIIEFLRRRYPTEVNFTRYEDRGEFLEGNGSLVFDRLQRVAYMASSTRSSERLAERWASLLGYRLLVFNAADRDGRPIFHTNLMMSICDDFILWCPEVIGEDSLSLVQEAMDESRRELIPFTRQQMMDYVGDLIHLGNKNSEINFLSTRAFNSLTDEQRVKIESFGPIVHTPLDTIEKYGGASAGSIISELA